MKKVPALVQEMISVISQLTAFAAAGRSRKFSFLRHSSLNIYSNVYTLCRFKTLLLTYSTTYAKH